MWPDSTEIHLRGKHVEVSSLHEEDIETLIALAADKRIWEHYTTDGSNPEKLAASFQTSLSNRYKGIEHPFVIRHHEHGRIIGSTRFLDMRPEHKKLEIGWTWLHPDFWGTTVNLECKLLLLTYCFEELTAIRVQLRTDENNIRSRRAIEKIGGLLEGIIRNDMIRDNGTYRNSAYYSIINNEWANVKRSLFQKLDQAAPSLDVNLYLHLEFSGAFC
ncbi:MAG TPA: GNAT family N-acetyltransferase [Patescibacteria group bacterium]|nr:GNAT family N-acetyltransferase [Patescibacteria group bacterium]